MFNEYEDSDSEISLASASVSDEDNEYPIKELIADKWCPTRQEQVYLVHWEGYEIERATWEPAESFEGDKIEIVHDYVQRKKHGMVPDFDYKKWDRDREREQEEREERQRKREERKERKAKKMALESKQQSKKGRQRREKLVNDSIRHSRRPSPELAGFIVSDDSGLDEEEPDKLPSMDEDSDEDIPVRKRNLRKTTKKKAPMLLIPITSDESGSDRGGSSSNDSLMAALSLAEKQKRGNKGKVKAEERRPIKRPLQRAVPKKRPLGKSPSGSPPRVRKRPTIASSSTTKPPTTGITASSRPTQNDFFPSLSIQNAVRKKSNTERAPPAEELNLINLGGGGASVRPMDTEKRPQDLDAHATRNTPSTQQVQKRKRSPLFTNEFRSSRHPGPGPRLPTQANSGPRTQSKPERSKQLGVIIRDQPPPRKRQMGELGMDALKNIYDAGHLPDPVPQTPHAQAPPVQRPLSPVRPSARAQPPPPQPTPHSHSFQSALPFQAATSFQQGFPFQSAAEFRITPPLQDMDMEPHHADTYECEVEYGPSLSTMESMGKVKFVGFSSEFLAMLHSIQLEKLWISKSLEISYISKHFVPGYGSPLEHADLIPSGDSTSFTNALSVFNGAGLILHEEFTLIVFQPSSDQLRTTFKTPLQRVKSPLRAVLYPPLNVKIPEPKRELAVMHKPFDPEFDSYLPNLMFRTLSRYGDCLKQKVPPDRRSYCVTYCPDIAKVERLELELALRLNGHRIFKTHDVPEVWKHRKISITVFVHQSLRYQLHLLPHIKLLRKLNSVIFRFFGTKLERGLDPRQGSLVTIDARFWSFGTIILLTPKFIVNNEAALSVVLQYQKAKAGSTKLCIPPKTVERIEKFILNSKAEDKGQANKILTLLYTIKDRLESNDVVELPIDGPVTMVSELEPGEIGKGGDVVTGTGTEIDVLVDRFALFHLEECEKWRRFIVCHSVRENVEGTKDLFPTVEFLDPDTVMKELGPKGQPPTTAVPLAQSPATQAPQTVQTPPTARTPLSVNR